MRRILALIIGLGASANGLWMIVVPLHWYAGVPGVSATGPANAHFIRDIGCAYLVSGVATLWLAIAPKQAWPAALAGGLFLILHAGVHLWDAAVGREPVQQLLREILTVILPGFIILWLVWPYFKRSTGHSPERAR